MLHPIAAASRAIRHRGLRHEPRDHLVGFVARKGRSVDAHQRADFVNDRVKDLSGGHAPHEERGDAPKRSLLGLDLREMRIHSGAIR